MIKNIAITFLFCLAVLIPQASFAGLSLSVNPVDGGNILRFERTPIAGAENKKEIRIHISSTNGSRYQVFQRILEPIINDKGEALNLQAVSVQTLPNSNSTGTLYQQNASPLYMSDQLLYSSDANGDSDAFVIGYNVNQALMNVSGNLRGRPVFTVHGEGNASGDQATIDVYLEKASSGLTVSIKGGHNPTRLHVRGTDTTTKTADFLNVSFSGNLGQEVRIYQTVETAPTNEMDENLDSAVLALDPEGSTDGLHLALSSPLSINRTLVYSSSRNEDSFAIYFLVNAVQVQAQDAGSYNGRVRYIVETSQGRQEFPIDIQCDIPPIFSMSVTTPPGGVAFSHIVANSPPQEKEVLVNVASNLHKPYQVNQGLDTNMTNNQGKEFENKYFTIQVEIPSGQRGQTNFVEFSPMQTGDYPIYSSDARGSGATFKVVYRLQGYDQMSPGDFAAPVRFSLNQK